MFAPKHIKNSVHFRKGVEKFVHYKRHLLPAATVAEIKAKLGDLRALEVSRADRDTLGKAQQELEEYCKQALPGKMAAPGWLGENVEVLFTAIIIALGIRAYFLQPFKIPTGSMQPTLNGVIARPMPADEPFPPLPVRAWEWVWKSRSYVEVKAPQDDWITGQKEKGFLMFFNSTVLETRSGKNLKIPAGIAVANQQLGFGEFMQRKAMQGVEPGRGGIPVKAGETIVRGWVQSGDQLLVDKMRYHFLRPSRGQVFVFNTKGIRGIEKSGSFKEEFGSQHYIKRLCAVPGDTLAIQPDGGLFINGSRAEGHGFGKSCRSKTATMATSFRPVARVHRARHSRNSACAWRIRDDA